MDDPVSALKERIRTVLERRSRQTVEREGLVPAAVLLPLLLRPDGLRVLFTKRSEHVAHHKGQISFPGGTVDAGDQSRLHTALREAQEEIGLAPESVEILGSLDDLETVVTGFVVTPFVGVVSSPFTYLPDGEEIERVIEVPLSVLLDPANFRVESWMRNGKPHPVYVYTCNDEVIWGLTAAILKQLLDLVFGERLA